MPVRTALTDRLGIAHPIIQAPMAGGTTTPDLVAAVSEAGGLGFIGAAYLSPQQIFEACRAVRARTSRPFGINLFAPTPAPAIGPQEAAVALVARYHAELGLPAPAVPRWAGDPFPEQVRAVAESGAAVFSFAFGLPAVEDIAMVKARGVYVAGTATTVEDAIALERAGVDAVAAQGAEAGAHRGGFSVDVDAAMIGTMALVPQIMDAVSIPVMAAGGIMDGRGIAAALALGAEAVQMGTAFLTCDEAGTSEAHKQAILNARAHQTRTTRAFSGRPARGIVNRFMAEAEDDSGAAILDYPLQNDLTRAMRGAAAKAGRSELLSLWAGQGFPLARRQSAAELVGRLIKETDEALHRLRTLQ